MCTILVNTCAFYFAFHLLIDEHSWRLRWLIFGQTYFDLDKRRINFWYNKFQMEWSNPLKFRSKNDQFFGQQFGSHFYFAVVHAFASLRSQQSPIPMTDIECFHSSTNVQRHFIMWRFRCGNHRVNCYLFKWLGQFKVASEYKWRKIKMVSINRGGMPMPRFFAKRFIVPCRSAGPAYKSHTIIDFTTRQLRPGICSDNLHQPLPGPSWFRIVLVFGPRKTSQPTSRHWENHRIQGSDKFLLAPVIRMFLPDRNLSSEHSRGFEMSSVEWSICARNANCDEDKKFLLLIVWRF